MSEGEEEDESATAAAEEKSIAEVEERALVICSSWSMKPNEADNPLFGGDWSSPAEPRIATAVSNAMVAVVIARAVAVAVAVAVVVVAEEGSK